MLSHNCNFVSFPEYVLYQKLIVVGPFLGIAAQQHAGQLENNKYAKQQLLDKQYIFAQAKQLGSK